MKKLIGADAICEFLQTDYRNLYKMRKRGDEIGNRSPIFTYLRGMTPNRRRWLWTYAEWLEVWWYQMHMEKELSRKKVLAKDI